jgi:hypothetical protein
MRSPLLTFTFFLSLRPAFVVGQGFLNSCGGFVVDSKDEHRIATYYQPADHNLPRRLTSIDLNLCPINANGKLYGQSK